MSTVSILCMTCCDRLNVCADDPDSAAKRVEVMAKEHGWIRVESEIDGRKHTADVCETCAAAIHDIVATGGDGRVVRKPAPPRTVSAEHLAELRAIIISQKDVVDRIDALCAATGLTRSELFAARSTAVRDMIRTSRRGPQVGNGRSSEGG